MYPWSSPARAAVFHAAAPTRNAARTPKCFTSSSSNCDGGRGASSPLSESSQPSPSMVGARSGQVVGSVFTHQRDRILRVGGVNEAVDRAVHVHVCEERGERGREDGQHGLVNNHGRWRSQEVSAAALATRLNARRGSPAPRDDRRPCRSARTPDTLGESRASAARAPRAARRARSRRGTRVARRTRRPAP